MDPLFLLPQQPAPIFGRTTNFEYKKCLPDNVFQSTAPAARHTFRWQNQAGEWWVPSQSYLRIRLGFGAVNDAGTGLRPITPADGVAPVMNLPPHLFTRMEYYMDGNKLSELQDFIPQIDTMKHRMMKSRAWMSSVGNRSCFWQPDFASRQKLITPTLGGSLNVSTLQTGDIPGQKIVMYNSRFIKRAGFESNVGLVAGNCFFAVYQPDTYLTGVQTPDVEVYGIQFIQTSAGPVRSTHDERLVKLGLPGTDTLATSLTSRVLLTLHFVNKQSRSMVATYLPNEELYVVHKGSNTMGVAEDAKRIASTTLSLPTGFTADAMENMRVLTYPQAITAGEATAADLLVNTNYVTDVTVTPLEPSQQIGGAARHEICWKPTLGIFDVAHALPTTRHELHLQIPNEYQLRCWDFGDTSPNPSFVSGRTLDARLSANASFADTDKGKVFLRIESLEFFAAMASGPRADDAKFVLDLREYRMIPQPIPVNQTPGTNTYPFNLASNTSSVSVAFQASSAGKGGTSLSKFIVPTQFSPRGAETALTRFYVNFANQNRPREENESFISYQGPNELVTIGTDRKGTNQFFTQRYLESMTNTGQLFKPGGCETLEEWLERGAYYNWMWPRDGNDLSTRFHVFCAFEEAKGVVANASELGVQLTTRAWPAAIDGQANDITILIFDMIPRAFSLTLRNGSVVNAETTSSMVADGVRRIRVE